MARVFVTVGMGPWPFDRLVAAVAPLCREHDVTVQTGPSGVRPPCPAQPYLTMDETLARLGAADVVVTHAGNTVRLVQRLGRVPVAVAREAARGEMGNDHQVDFLEAEERTGRVVAVWDVDQLPDVVARHADLQERLLAERPLPEPVPPEDLVATLDGLCARLVRPDRRFVAARRCP
jgi:UDP-N-acetylglucosamine transferase subunit ALG13